MQQPKHSFLPAHVTVLKTVVLLWILPVDPKRLAVPIKLSHHALHRFIMEGYKLKFVATNGEIKKYEILEKPLPPSILVTPLS